MNKEEIKILSYLSDNFGDGGNILEMSKGIDKRYGPAYYPNIYNTARKLEKIGIIYIEHEGNSKLIRLNTENPLSTYYISEIENYKNQRTAIPKEMLSSILNLSHKFDIFSICAVLSAPKIHRYYTVYFCSGSDLLSNPALPPSLILQIHPGLV